MLAPILVRKLNSASEPTARRGGTPKPKIRIGSSKTPPPTPVIPMRVPTTKPIKLLISRSMTVPASAFQSKALGRLRRCTDKAFPFEMQNNFLCRLFSRQLAGINDHISVSRSFVRIRNPRELLENSGARFGVQTFAVPLFADLYRGCNVDQNEASVGFDHLPHM